MKKTRQTVDHGLFDKEERILERARQFLDAPSARLDDALDELGRLTKDYKRLLRLTRNLTRVSDRSQHKLHTTSTELDAELGRQVGKEIKDDLLRGAAKGAPTLRDLTVAFVDIRNFTTFAEQLPPDQVISFLKAYYEYSLEIVHNHGGLVKSFMGDGVMLVFGYNQTDHRSDQAIACAVEILERLPEFNRRQNASVRLGIGLHSGPTAVGLIGSADRYEFAVIGNTVNMASRIESETKIREIPLLFSGQVLDILDQSPRPAEFVASLTLRGQRGVVDLYTLENT